MDLQQTCEASSLGTMSLNRATYSWIQKREVDWRILVSLSFFNKVMSVAAPMSAGDGYSFGVMLLEKVACGRRPIETSALEEEVMLINWVRDLYER
ncbi:hypothetical protein K1719_011062 [Acacia pycnantha]|nr:hypothetical protein K1719_011062 [Acacia pycnantha]